MWPALQLVDIDFLNEARVADNDEGYKKLLTREDGVFEQLADSATHVVDLISDRETLSTMMSPFEQLLHNQNLPVLWPGRPRGNENWKKLRAAVSRMHHRCLQLKGGSCEGIDAVLKNENVPKW